MYSALLLGFLTVIPSAWRASAVQVVKRGSIGGLLPRQSSTSCGTICTPAENALSTCTAQACLCTTTNANSLQQCVNCFLAASSDATTVSSVNEIVSDFELLCGTFPIPTITVNTAGSISTPVGTPTKLTTSPSPTSNSNINSATTPIATPGGAGTTSPANGGSASTPASSVSDTFLLPTTIAQITIGPSDVSGPSNTAPAASTTGPITFGGLSSGSSGGRIADFVLLTVFGAGTLLLVL